MPKEAIYSPVDEHLIKIGWNKEGWKSSETPATPVQIKIIADDGTYVELLPDQKTLVSLAHTLRKVYGHTYYSNHEDKSGPFVSIGSSVGQEFVKTYTATLIYQGISGPTMSIKQLEKLRDDINVALAKVEN